MVFSVYASYYDFNIEYHKSCVEDKNNIQGIINDDNEIKIRRVTNGNNFLERTIRSLFLGFYIIKDRCKIVHYQGVHTPLYGLLFGESMIFTFLLLKVFQLPHKLQYFSILHCKQHFELF